MTTGVVVLVTLLLVPGLLAARAPFTCVPALSASFWIVSSWWLPASVGRERFLRAILVGGGLLALVRLRELPRGRPPLRAVAIATAVALPLVLALVPMPLAPSFSATSATLVVWNDGIPSSYQPLLDLAPFGADGPGLATLAADVALLSGLPPTRAVAVVGLAASSLLCLGVLELRRAAAPALVALATALLAGLVLRADSTVLALALAVSSYAILLGGDSLLRSLAASLLLAGCLLSESLIGVTALLAVGLGLRPWSSPLRRNRTALVLVVALVLAVPQIQRLGSAFSFAELRFLGARPCPALPWIYQYEAAKSAHPCALTLFDKLLGNPDLSRSY